MPPHHARLVQARLEHTHLVHATLAVLLAWLILLAPGTARADPPPTHFEVALVAEVFATALAFMEPRTLEAVPPPQLALWGLRGLTALDPALATDVRDGAIQLSLAGQGGGERLLAARPIPAAEDIRGWANASALLSQAGWAASGAVRRAGTTGVVQSYFDEMFNHLDPYSRYVPPDEAASERELRVGDASIGLRLSRQGRTILVQSVLPDGPAEAAGIQPGDVLVAVDGQAVLPRQLADVVRSLSGAEDSRVTVTIVPGRGVGRRGPPRDVSLVRVTLPPQTVFAELRGGVLLVRITGFSRNTGQLLAREILLAIQGGSLGGNLGGNLGVPGAGETGREPGIVRGVILDLRGNRGGLLQQAVAVAGTALASGVVATTSGRDPAADHQLRTDGADLTGGLPVVVIVDGRSASAAEIVAAALADQGRAVVIGSSTLGKGLVQTILPLPDHGELFVTWSRVLAPAGWPLQSLGVLPQLCTSLGHDFLERQQAALLSGHNLLAPVLAQSRGTRAPVPLSQILAIRGACPAAEGRDADVAAARFLIDNPPAYQAALLRPAAAN